MEVKEGKLLYHCLFEEVAKHQKNVLALFQYSCGVIKHT